MCGKPNPAELDECQYCQARLRPIWESAPIGDQLEASDEQGQELPDWLKSLRTPEDDQAEQSPAEPEERSTLPGWLSDLRRQPAELGEAPPEEISEEVSAAADESSAEWLQSLLTEDDLAQDEAFAKQMNDAFRRDDAGWRSRVDSTPFTEEPPEEPSDTLDWLTELEQAAPDLTPSNGQDWYSPIEPQTTQASESLPAWLTHAGAEESEPPEQEAIHRASSLEDLGVPQLPQEFEAEPELGEELPAWLQQAADSVRETDETGEPGETDFTDWKKLEAAEAVEQEAGGEPALDWLAGSGEEEELPDWLFAQEAAMETGAPQVEPSEPGTAPGAFEPAQETPESPETPEEGLLDWLLSEEEIPDWLAAEEEIPDWLKASSPTQEPEVVPPFVGPVPESLFAEELLPGEMEPTAEAGMPFEEALPLPVEDETAEVIPVLEIGDRRPQAGLEWLSELESVYGDLSPNAPEGEEAEAGAGESLGPGAELPVWLSKTVEEEEGILAESAEGEGELKPADLPSWLQAMRPVGVTAAAASLLGESEPLQIEGAGPLAGLRGVLPAEPDVSQVQKPPMYSVKLQVTDAQQMQAELLRGIVDAEGAPRPVSAERAIRSQRILRLVIAVLLILPLVFVLLTGFPQLNLPAPSLDVMNVGRLIEGIQPGAPVLLAVDYQPAFSSEMDAIASPVIQHLFDRGAYLTIVSTIPTGPVQAERLLAGVRGPGGVPLQGIASSANLGYIPGGATGLLAFVRAPRQVFATTLRGERLWELPALQPVNALNEFALVVVLTENPDIARYWIEQVQPLLGTTPLVMALSAQADPMIRPYYHSSPQQVQGLVSGLAGGSAYLAQRAQRGAATQFWSPYGVGAFVAVVLMALTGLMNLVAAQVAHRKERTGGKKRS
jgi:hypothetical protein